MGHGVGVQGVLDDLDQSLTAGVAPGVYVEDDRHVPHHADRPVHSEVGSDDRLFVHVAGKLFGCALKSSGKNKKIFSSLLLIVTKYFVCMNK